MGKSDNRVVSLQRQVKIARAALTKISLGCRDAEGVATEVIDEMWPLDKKQPLQGLVGHEKKSR